MKHLPCLSNSDRRALLLLEWVLLLVVVGLALFGWRSSGGGGRPAASAVADSAQARASSPARKYVYAKEEEPVETFPFDPNTADSTALLRLGLAPWQVKAVYSYRAKHGRYHEPQDFKRLPGMTNELWERLKPCIRIDRRFQYVEPEPRRRPEGAGRPAVAETVAAEPPARSGKATDSVSLSHKGAAVEGTSLPASASTGGERDTSLYPEKFAPGTLVDLNEADTSVLKRVPGIASYRARKIVEYRRRLGGFRNKEQVMEACQLPDEVLDWFAVKPSPLVRLDVNHLSVSQLMKHPYLSFYQAKAIVEYRSKFGSLKSIQDLQNLKEFTPQEIERLRDYLEFR
ncbi:MAG: helix-hairpin-helix domain-containing protein [Bacteroidaceae bacterium]|nr:helix-hairpin-helix domain-containing protein [Bacteroidaceae bacterium]